MKRLDLKKIAIAALLLGLTSIGSMAQESPAPSASPDTTASPILSGSPGLTEPPSPSPSPARSARITFLPPPLEGKISLGIYNSAGELVRVLHKEAGVSEFTVGPDALVTKWDGKDDHGQDRPPGRYHARGFLVGTLKIEEMGTTAEAPTDASLAGTVQVKLMPNPLIKDAGINVDLTVAFDDRNTYLRTADGLPLYTTGPNASASRAWIRKNGEKAVDIFFDNNGTIAQYRVSNIDKMMAFDGGDFDLR